MSVKKIVKAALMAGTAAAAISAVSTYRQYHKMKQMEKKLEELPLHRLKKNMATIHRDEEKTVIEVPKETTFLDRVRMSAHILIP